MPIPERVLAAGILVEKLMAHFAIEIEAWLGFIAIDLAALSGLTRVVAFLGVGALLLVIGYVAPLPPATKNSADA